MTIGLSLPETYEFYWLAVDDIRFTDCDPGHLNGPGECDFELDTCDYSNLEARDDFDWTRHQGPTPSYNTGPKTDHTTLTDKGRDQEIHSELKPIFNLYFRIAPLFPL